MVYPHIGADPELFLTTDEGIIGSERAIPKEGVQMGWGHGIVRDGVQVELHPAPSTCRQSFGAGLWAVMNQLVTTLQTQKGVKPSFEQVVKVSKKELDQLSDDAKVLGCAPSLNSHRPRATVRVAKRDQRVRSAGGHVHLGVESDTKADLATDEKGNPKFPEKVKKLVNLLDVLVGLPCVLIDRDPNQKIRRRIYGRAGEHRLPKHGIEYRTPSNFWLRHYYLMHFVTGMARLALECYYRSFIYDQVYLANFMKQAPAGTIPRAPINFNFYDSLMEVVDMRKVEKAINRNDFDLAMEQWLPVHDWIETHVGPHMSCGLGAGTKDNFLFFVNKIKESGLEYWFADNPITAWHHKHHGSGFEYWLNSQVGAERRQIRKEGVANVSRQ